MSVLAGSETRPAVAAPLSAVSWGAVFAGAILAATATLSLLFLCAAAGLTMVSPWSGQGVGTTTFAVSAAIGMIGVQWISSALGGFVTGRLRTRWAELDSDEVFFRDTVNGLVAWSLATLLVACMVAGSATMTARTGVQAAATVASGAASGAGAAAAGGEGASLADPSGYFVDLLFRTGPNASTAAPGATDQRAEVTRILARSAASGGVSAPDKAYLAQLAAQRAGISAEEATRRVDDMLAQVQAAKVKAQEAADAARKAGALGALLTFLSLLIGAFIAAVSAALGASYRDEVKTV